MREEDLYKIIRNVFEIDSSITLNHNMGPDDIPRWDSIGLLNLFIEINKEFDIEFSIENMADVKDIGSLLKLVS